MLASSAATPGGGGATPGTGAQEEEEHEVVRVRVKVSDLVRRFKDRGRVGHGSQNEGSQIGAVPGLETSPRKGAYK